MQCYDCQIRRLALYKDATSSDIEKLMSAKNAELVLRKGQLIMDGHRGASLVMTLQDGLAFSFILLNDGRRQILNFFHPGDMISPPVLSGRSVHAGVRALTDVTVCQFDREEFYTILQESKPLTCGAFSFFEDQRRIAEEALVGLGTLSAEEAVASMILSFMRRARKSGNQSNRIKFPLRLSHIAEAVGITEIHAGRVMRGLEKRGLIKRETADFLVIDIEGLQQLVPNLSGSN
jgi:CRP-like cAMP-binding protein